MATGRDSSHLCDPHTARGPCVQRKSRNGPLSGADLGRGVSWATCPVSAQSHVTGVPGFKFSWGTPRTRSLLLALSGCPSHLSTRGPESPCPSPRSLNVLWEVQWSAAHSVFEDAVYGDCTCCGGCWGAGVVWAPLGGGALKRNGADTCGREQETGASRWPPAREEPA